MSLLAEFEWLSFSQEMYGNSLQRWLAALAAWLLITLLLRIAKGIVERWAAKAAARPRWSDLGFEAAKATKLWFLWIVSAYCAALLLVLPEKAQSVIASITIIGLLLQGGVWANLLLVRSTHQFVERRRETDADAVTTVSALAFLAKIALWSIVTLLVLENLGIDITTLVAGLGVGGIAVALAAQNILGDLFASLSIVLDKPFVLGDFIIVGEQMGTVERIGLKTTRLRSLSGEQLIFSNNDLLQSRIRNFKRMYERRVVFSLGVVYDTPAQKLREIPAVIRQIIESEEPVRFDRCHFKEYGESSLNFETVYFVLSSDYRRFMDIQQNINLAIYQSFEAQQIEFAFPTRTVLVQRQQAGIAHPVNPRETSHGDESRDDGPPN